MISWPKTAACLVVWFASAAAMDIENQLARRDARMARLPEKQSAIENQRTHHHLALEHRVN